MTKPALFSVSIAHTSLYLSKSGKNPERDTEESFEARDIIDDMISDEKDSFEFKYEKVVNKDSLNEEALDMNPWGGDGDLKVQDLFEKDMLDLTPEFIRKEPKELVLPDGYFKIQNEIPHKQIKQVKEVSTGKLMWLVGNKVSYVDSEPSWRNVGKMYVKSKEINSEAGEKFEVVWNGPNFYHVGYKPLAIHDGWLRMYDNNQCVLEDDNAEDSLFFRWSVLLAGKKQVENCLTNPSYDDNYMTIDDDSGNVFVFERIKP